ncbi:regulatory protein PchR [Abditibacteriota bacterium]|nr:regulatory protein PchR [Abditibacteriota bacterium]
MSLESAPAPRPFVPFIRWANTVRVPRGGRGAFKRRLYDHELVYVLEGCGQIILDGQAHDANPDHLFLVQPGVFHSFLSPTEEQRLLGVHFDFEPHLDTSAFTEFEPAPDVPDRTRLRPRREIEGWSLAAYPFLDLTGHPRVRRQLEEVVAEYSRHDQQSRFVAGALLLAVFGQIERELRLIGEVARHERVGADAVRRVQRAREQLEHELESPPSIETIAARVGWSGDHLRRMFRAVLNTSPLEIQTSARIRRAQELLRYGELPTREVASRCGFDDPSHFSRVFKRETGLSPREWQNITRIQYRS